MICPECSSKKLVPIRIRGDKDQYFRCKRCGKEFRIDKDKDR